MLDYKNKNALHPPAVIVVHQDTTLSYPSHVPSTRFPTGTVLALPAAFGFKDYHPLMSLNFSSCGSHYPETPGTFIGGDDWSRTSSAVRRRIYSPLGLPIFLHLQNGTGYGNRTRLTNVKGLCPNR
jgi:hypothetical protein